MSDWTEGYVADIQYTSGFYRELSPAWLNMLAVMKGQPAIDLEQPFTWVELGCGQGITANLLAAVYPQGQFWAADFMPGQIANARRLAAEAKLANISFVEASFAELAQGSIPCPQADFIVLHGIYSWVSRENQLALVEIARRQLKPGGLFYVSYNTAVGWAAMQPVQQMMSLFAAQAVGSSADKAASSVAQCKALLDGGARYFELNPFASKRLEHLARQDGVYVAHEYLNGNWQPLSHVQLANDFAPAKLEYLGSATMADNYDVLTIPQPLQAYFKSLADGPVKEAVRELAGGLVFRRDVFVRGKTILPALVQNRLRRQLQFRRCKLVSDFAKPLTLNSTLGKGEGKPRIYEPILRALDQGAATVGDVAVADEHGNGFQAFALLAQEQYAHPLGDQLNLECAKQAARAINLAIVNRTLAGNPHGFLAAPVIGSALPAGVFEQAMWWLHSEERGVQGEQLIDRLLGLLQQAGFSLTQDGSPLSDSPQLRQRLQQSCENFSRELLPIWLELGVL